MHENVFKSTFFHRLMQVDEYTRRLFEIYDEVTTSDAENVCSMSETSPGWQWFFCLFAVFDCFAVFVDKVIKKNFLKVFSYYFANSETLSCCRKCMPLFWKKCWGLPTYMKNVLGAETENIGVDISRVLEKTFANIWYFNFRVCAVFTELLLGL